MSEGLDFAWGRPGGAAIKAAGKTFVMRYLYPDGQGGKGLDASEVSDYRNHGLLIGAVYESSANRALAGRAAGAADARTSAAQLAVLGMTGTVVYFGVDFDVTSQMAALKDYLAGAASVLGSNKVGVYGEFDVIEQCVGVVCGYGWQTYAWSRGKVSSKANVYQYKNGQTLNGASVDLCRSLKTDFGAFGGTSLTGDIGSPITNPTPANEWNDDMGLRLYSRTDAPTSASPSGVTYALGSVDPGWHVPGRNFWFEATAESMRDWQDLYGPSKNIPNDTWDARSNDPNRISDVSKYLPPVAGGATAVTLTDAQLAAIAAHITVPTAETADLTPVLTQITTEADRVIGKIPTEFAAK